MLLCVYSSNASDLLTQNMSLLSLGGDKYSSEKVPNFYDIAIPVKILFLLRIMLITLRYILPTIVLSMLRINVYLAGHVFFLKTTNQLLEVKHQLVDKGTSCILRRQKKRMMLMTTMAAVDSYQQMQSFIK